MSSSANRVLSGKYQPVLLASLLALAVALVFGRAASFAFVSYDDPLYITDNPPVLAGLTAKGALWAFTTTHAFLWHPLTWISHMIDVSVWGLWPGGHHLTSVALHAASSAALFLALDRLTRSESRGRCFTVAALFALHPMRAESVAWAAERKDTLSVFFAIVTLYVYARYVEKPRPARMALVIASFVLALLAKPMVITLPFALLLLDAWPLGRLTLARPTWWRCLAEKIPLFALSIAVVLKTLSAQGAALSRLGLGERAANSVWSAGRYVAHSFVPYRLTLFYPYPSEGAPPLSPVAVALVGLALVVAAVVAFRWRNEHPYILFGLAWFFGLLFPVIGLFQSGGGAMADRFAYLPSIGLLIAVVWLASALAHRLVAPQRVRPLLRGVAAVVIASSAAATFVEVGYYRDTRTLFTRAIVATGTNWLGESQLGFLALNAGDGDDALRRFLAAYRLAPHSPNTLANVGRAYESVGRRDDEIAFFLAVQKDNPDDGVTQNMVGVALAAVKQYRPAIAAFQRATELDPDEMAPYYNLASLYRMTGRPDLADRLERQLGTF